MTPHEQAELAELDMTPEQLAARRDKMEALTRAGE